MITRQRITRRRRCPCELRRQTQHQREKVDARKLPDNRREMPHQERWFCEMTKKETKTLGKFNKLGEIVHLFSFRWPDEREITSLPMMPHMWASVNNKFWNELIKQSSNVTQNKQDGRAIGYDEVEWWRLMIDRFFRVEIISLSLFWLIKRAVCLPPIQPTMSHM